MLAAGCIGGEPERRSGSNISGHHTTTGGIAEVAEAAAEFFRKSFSFNTRASFGHQQASSPSGASNHRPWMANNNNNMNRESDYRESDSNVAIAALTAAVRGRNSDGGRGSNGTLSTGTRPSQGILLTKIYHFSMFCLLLIQA